MSSHRQALIGIAESAETLIRLIDEGKYLLRADLQRAEWEHIALIARGALAKTPPTKGGLTGGHSSPSILVKGEGPGDCVRAAGDDIEAPRPEDFARAFGAGVMQTQGVTLIGDGEKMFAVEDPAMPKVGDKIRFALGLPGGDKIVEVADVQPDGKGGYVVYPKAEN